jgi:membrane-associated phospholipid phosphatase
MSSNRGLAEAASSSHPQAGRGGGVSIRRPRIIGELLVVAVLLWAYDVVRGHADVREMAALRNGRQLLDLERWLGIDIELAANLWTTQRTALSLAASYWYQFTHLSVTLGVLVWCWWRRAGSYRRARNALVLTNVFGLIFFMLYPVAPPRFLPGFVDSVANAGFGPTHGGPVTADQFGAFPSLHLAWAVWTAVVAHRLVRSTPLRWLWLCYPMITAVVVVVTGNHYLVDVLAGLLIALATLVIAHRIPRRRRDDRHRPGGSPAGQPSGSLPGQPGGSLPGQPGPANPTGLKPFLDSSDSELTPSRHARQ